MKRASSHHRERSRRGEDGVDRTVTLDANRDRIEVYWLPPYCPSLNLIERLWGHLKRTALANVLFVTIDDLVRAFRKGVTRVNGRRERMGFMFRHDRDSKQAV
jgi:transposase